MYYRGAQAAIVVYDITNEVSPGFRWPAVTAAVVSMEVRPGAVIKLDFLISDMILLHGGWFILLSDTCGSRGYWMSVSWLHVTVFDLAGVVCAGKELGQRATETSEPQHCNSSGRKQGRSGQQKGAGLPGRVSSCLLVLSLQMWLLQPQDFSSFDRMPSHTQMTTAYSSWKHQQRPQWMWARSSWPSVRSLSVCSSVAPLTGHLRVRHHVLSEWMLMQTLDCDHVGEEMVGSVWWYQQEKSLLQRKESLSRCCESILTGNSLKSVNLLNQWFELGMQIID